MIETQKTPGETNPTEQLTPTESGGVKHERNTRLCPPWPKGTSGNPAGRPKKIDTVLSLLKDKLAEPVQGRGGRTWAEVLVDVLVVEGIGHRNLRAIEMILDRLYGKPKGSLEISGGQEPVKIRYLSDTDLEAIVQIYTEAGISVSQTSLGPVIEAHIKKSAIEEKPAIAPPVVITEEPTTTDNSQKEKEKAEEKAVEVSKAKPMSEALKAFLTEDTEGDG